MATGPAHCLWLVRQRAGRMGVGDAVFLWRAVGGGDSALSGVLSEAEIAEPPAVQPEDAAAAPFWVRGGVGGDPTEPRPQVRLRLVRTAGSGGIVRRDAALADPVLSGMTVLTRRTGTNFLLRPEQAERLAALWAGAGAAGAGAAEAGAPGGSPAAEIEADIAAVEADAEIDPTTRAALVEARRGQGRFRAGLLRRWGGACAVTGLTLAQVLRASHAKPWREASDAERLDPKNGLLLAAHLDALFDTGLVSFADDGAMVVSSAVFAADRGLLGIPQRLRERLDAKERSFMALHRSSKFRG